MKKSKAFSLVELSVVLLVISLMSVGVLQGTSAIKQARITNARSITSTSPVPTIDGLVAWYEPTLIKSFKTNELENGSQITAWYDISPSSIIKKRNTLTTAATSSIVMASQGINKLPSVSFGWADGLHLTSFYQGTTPQNTVFFVSQPFSLSGSADILIDSGSGDICSFGFFPSGVEIHIGGGNPSLVAATTITPGTNYIMAGYYNGSLSKIYVNDANTAISLNSGSGSYLVGLSVGASAAESWKFNGLISEVIVYNRVINGQERKDIMRYLSKKYGVAVANL